jgi:molybdopterin-binding protein
LNFLEVLILQVSARNQLKGKVTNIKNGPISTEITLDINGQSIVSVITTESASSMGIGVGDDVSAVIKASSVMIMK